ncbi:MAG: response regulator [Bryobacteraceae bacterium]
MTRILLIEDDADQRRLRTLLLESRGYRVLSASCPSEALEILAEASPPPRCILMDLRLPRTEDGRALIRELHSRCPSIPVIVLTGAAGFESAPERALVREVLRKPVRSERLLGALSRLAAFLLASLLPIPAAAQSRSFPFTLDAPAEVVAELELSSPASDWAVRGREAAVAAIGLEGETKHHVFVFGEKDSRLYRVFLGPLAPGPHILTVSRDAGLSAPGSGLVIGEARISPVRPGDPLYEPVRHAPILFSRAGAPDRFSDALLLVYCTQGRDRSGPWIEYTAVFSNEDGGTSTRDLMARWGRTTDIEYVYRVWLDREGRPARTLIQTREHQDVSYDGPWFGLHPLLVPVTDNNMVEPAGAAVPPLRFQLVPTVVSLDGGSRELVMDQHPFTYEIACKEIARESKIRPQDTWFDGEKIADPRRYFIAEFQAETRNAAVQLLYRLRGENLWRGSALGIGKNFIERDGWVRTALELPEGRSAAEIGEFAFECLSRRDLERQPVPKNGTCHILRLGRFFAPDARCRPGAALAVAPQPEEGWRLRVGELVTFAKE